MRLPLRGACRVVRRHYKHRRGVRPRRSVLDTTRRSVGSEMASLGGRPPRLRYLKGTAYRAYPSNGEHLVHHAHAVSWFCVTSVLKRWDIMKRLNLSMRLVQIELLFDDIRLLRRDVPKILEPKAYGILSMVQRQVTSSIKYLYGLSSRKEADRYLRKRLA